MTEAYPLAWPATVRRTAWASRRPAPFGSYKDRGTAPRREAISITEGRDRLIRQIALLRDAKGRPATGVVISSDLRLRNDGLPLGRQSEPADPGVAVYFHLGGKPYCLPCDRWDRVADNLAAVAAHIEATRAIERYGVGTVEQAFSGFVALPPPSQERPWREVFGLHRAGPVTLDAVETRYRELAKERHPDRTGGDHGMMAELNRARDAARKELCRAA